MLTDPGCVSQIRITAVLQYVLKKCDYS